MYHASLGLFLGGSRERCRKRRHDSGRVKVETDTIAAVAHEALQQCLDAGRGAVGQEDQAAWRRAAWGGQVPRVRR